MRWAADEKDTVEMNPAEWQFAGNVAVMRSVSNKAKGRQPAYGLDGKGLGLDIHWQGCLSEMALAFALGEHWMPLRFGGADVGEDYQVRSTVLSVGSLVLHEPDDPRQRFFLAVIEYPRIRIAGWIYARDGKRPEYWRDDLKRPCFMVPQTALLPMERPGDPNDGS